MNFILYEIVQYNHADQMVKAYRIYDENALLLLNEDEQNTLNVKVDEVLDNMHMMDEDEEVGIRTEMQNESHIVKIKFQVEESDNNLECIPISVDPAFVNINDYHIHFNPSQRCIGKVTSNKYGSIKFTSEEFDINDEILSMPPIDIWTTLTESEQLRIVFCQLVDKNESASISLNHMPPDASIQDYHEFGTDETGQVIRYKILMQDQMVVAILYNLGK